MQDGDIMTDKEVMRDTYLRIRQELCDLSSQKDVSLPFSFHEFVSISGKNFCIDYCFSFLVDYRRLQCFRRVSQISDY